MQRPGALQPWRSTSPQSPAASVGALCAALASAPAHERQLSLSSASHPLPCLPCALPASRKLRLCPSFAVRPLCVPRARPPRSARGRPQPCSCPLRACRAPRAACCYTSPPTSRPMQSPSTPGRPQALPVAAPAPAVVPASTRAPRLAVLQCAWLLSCWCCARAGECSPALTGWWACWRCVGMGCGVVDWRASVRTRACDCVACVHVREREKEKHKDACSNVHVGVHVCKFVRTVLGCCQHAVC